MPAGYLQASSHVREPEELTRRDGTNCLRLDGATLGHSAGAATRG
jgi:hypothetical protein